MILARRGWHMMHMILHDGNIMHVCIGAYEFMQQVRVCLVDVKWQIMHVNVALTSLMFLRSIVLMPFRMLSI